MKNIFKAFKESIDKKKQIESKDGFANKVLPTKDYIPKQSINLVDVNKL